MHKKLVSSIIIIFMTTIIACKSEYPYKATVIKKTPILEIPGKYETRKGILNKGEPITVYDEKFAKGGIWVKIKPEGGETYYWIKKDSIIKGRSFAITIIKRTPLMSRPTELSILERILKPGEKGIAIKEYKSWLKIALEDNTIGWIKSGNYKKGFIDIEPKPPYVRGIGPVSIEASNFIYPKTPDILYCFPEDALDGDPKTSWLFSYGKRKAIGWIEITFPESVDVKISMINGVSSNPEIYSKNKIIKNIILTTKKEESLYFSEEIRTVEESKEITLEDNMPFFQSLGTYSNIKAFTIKIIDYYDRRKTYAGIAEIKIEKY